MESGEGCKETFVNGFAQCCGRGISKGRMEEQCQRFGVGLGIGAVAEMSGWTCVVSLTGTSQSPLAARWPLKIGLFLSVMLTSWFRSRCICVDVKMAVQLESQAWPIDSKGA